LMSNSPSFALKGSTMLSSIIPRNWTRHFYGEFNL
jgi:hypothetical protein